MRHEIAIPLMINDGAQQERVLFWPDADEKLRCGCNCKSKVNDFDDYCTEKDCIYLDSNKDYLDIFIEMTVKSMEGE